MSRPGIGKMGAAFLSALVATFAIGLAIGPATSRLEASGSSAISVDRAQLAGGQLRLEGVTEPSTFIIIVDRNDEVIVIGTADGVGGFRVEAEGVSSPSCVGSDNQVGVAFLSNDELLLFEVVTLDPCTPL